MNIKYILAFNESDYESIKMKHINDEDETNKLEGRLLGGRYKIVKKIGEKFNIIEYRAKCELTNNEYIIEIQKKKYTEEENSFALLFEEECAKFINRNIMRTYDVGMERGIVYAIKEITDLKPLDYYLMVERNIGVEQAINISKQIINGLLYVHSTDSIVGNDGILLWPGNIYIDSKSNIKINVVEYNPYFEDTSVFKYYYMSPEFFQENKYYEITSEIYSLGCIMYVLFTGKVPYKGNKSKVELALDHFQTVPETPKSINQLIPESISNVIEKCMQKNPAERYQSCEEILNDCSLLRMQ